MHPEPIPIGVIGLGVIGLGAMGCGMAGSLRRAGYAVQVCDLRAEAAQAFAAGGGTACATPADLAAHCGVVVGVMVNAAQTEDLVRVLQAQTRRRVGLVAQDSASRRCRPPARRCAR